MESDEKKYPAIVEFEVEDMRTKKTKYTSIYPNTDFAVLFVAQMNRIHWRKSGYTTDLITIDEFDAITANYEILLAESGNSKSERTPTIARIHLLIEMAAEGLNAVKDLLDIEYTPKIAVSHYPSVGAQFTNGRYFYPKDYDGITVRMRKTIEGLAKHGFENHTKYGLTFWQPLYDEFVELTQLNKNLTGSGSSSRGTKNELKEKLQETQRLLILMLRLNKGSIWESVAREWGFQKERY